MKELIGSSRNIRIAERDGKLVPQIETIIITSETVYKHELSGLLQLQKTGDLRFETTPKGLRALAKRLEEFADEAEALEKGIEGNKNDTA